MVLGLLVLDQVSKALVRGHMALHQSILLLGDDFLRLTYVLNPGIAFGMRSIGVKPLLIFGWVATIILTWYLYSLVRRGDPLRWPVSLFLAGAMGNSIDRLLFGQVTDFADVDFPDFIMERWPIFNVADSCVTIGIALLLLIVIFHRPQAHAEHAAPYSSPETLPTQDGAGSGPSAH
jgi:signal peptidase II